MTQSLDVRTADSADASRIRSLVERSMTASYAMSPRDIEAVMEGVFSDGEDGFGEGTTLVAETDEGVIGTVQGTREAERGIVSHLHVHPEHRGLGAGTALFEAIRSTLDDRGADRVWAVAFAAATEGGEFYNRFDYEVVDQQSVEVGGISTVRYVYGDVPESETAATADSTATPEDPPEVPDTLTTEDGETVYTGDELLFGTEGAFAPTYADESRHEAFGYYCTNCESTAVTVGSSDRLVCDVCDNTRRPTETYDGSYL